MKLFKTFAATAAVATMVMFSGCQDTTEATEEELADHGITLNEGAVYNAEGGNDAKSGFNIVKGENVSGDGVNADNTPKYNDSSIVDFRSINSNGRASTLTASMTSVNGTLFAAVTPEEFEDVTKNIKKFKERLMAKADAIAETETVIEFDTETPYYVAKLGYDRGYALVETVKWTPDDATLTSKTNLGSIDFKYYHVQSADLAE